MKRGMLPRLFVLGSLLLLAAPAIAQDRPDAMLVLADDGGLDASAVHAIRNIAATELRKRGIALSEDRRTEGTRPIDGETSKLAVELGARRLFALRIGGRLGQKIPLSLEELAPGTLVPVYAASMTAFGLEECDVVTERLVQAVVSRKSAESTAEMTTVTRTESKPFAKKPGERFWFIGLPVAIYGSGSPFGLSIGYGYEAENFRVSATGGGFSRGDDGISFLELEASWIPLAGEWSPYLGGGIGYIWAKHAGMGGVLEAGLEAFRLHGVRGLAGVQAMIPFFDTTYQKYDSAGVTTSTVKGRTWYPAVFVRLAF